MVSGSIDVGTVGAAGPGLTAVIGAAGLVAARFLGTTGAVGKSGKNAKPSWSLFMVSIIVRIIRRKSPFHPDMHLAFSLAQAASWFTAWIGPLPTYL
jgi:hypothetical protein